MAMPKKGTRKINVDDEIYTWKVFHDYHGLHYMFFIIENSDNKDYQIFGDFNTENIIISPNVISQIISLATKDGWLSKKGKDRKYRFKDYYKLKINIAAIWKPAFFNYKQILKKGTKDTFYFNRLNGLSFSWGEYDSINDFKASCRIDKISHKVYGELDYIESIGDMFIIKGVKIDKKMTFNQINNDIEKMYLKIYLSEFIVLDKNKSFI